MRYAIINSSNAVINVIELEDNEVWLPPEGHSLVAGSGNIGDTWDGAQFHAPAVPPVETTLADVKAEAQRRIGLLFGGKTGAALVYAEINAIASGTFPAAEIAAIRAASDAIEARLVSDPYLDPKTQPEWPVA